MILPERQSVLNLLIEVVKMINYIQIEEHKIPYIIEYKRIKNIYFRLKEDGIIHVSANKMVSKKYIDCLLNNNQEAIKKMLNRQDIIKQENEKLLYLGNELNLIESSSKPFIENNYIYAKSNEEAQKYIIKCAYNVFNNRLNQIKLNFIDLPNFTLKVRKMTSKWGVCNKKSMTVTLNTDLIHKDVHLIDYVIVHELCHFKYMNHSKDFWNLVAAKYPYYKRARKELNNL